MEKERMLTALDVFQTVENVQVDRKLEWELCVVTKHTHTYSRKREGKRRKRGGGVLERRRQEKKKMDVNGPKNKNSYTPLKFGGLKEIGVQWI